MKQLTIVLFFLFAASVFAAEPTEAQKAIVGTWRFALVDGQKFPSEFYMKCNPDGTVQTWPSPHEGRFNTKDGVSSGDYRIDENFFYLGREKSDDIKSSYKLVDNTFTITADNGHVLVYQRVENPPEPGQLKASQNKTGEVAP